MVASITKHPKNSGPYSNLDLDLIFESHSPRERTFRGSKSLGEKIGLKLPVFLIS